jgi:hypothetical protein
MAKKASRSVRKPERVRVPSKRVTHASSVRKTADRLTPLTWVDYLEWTVPFRGELSSDHFIVADANGEVRSVGENKVRLEGAYGVTVATISTRQIRDEEKRLHIRVNPAKWSTGHNLFGSDGPAYEAIRDITRAIFAMMGVERIPKPHRVRIVRVDLARNLSLGSRSIAEDFIHRAHFLCINHRLPVANCYPGSSFRSHKNAREGSALFYVKEYEIATSTSAKRFPKYKPLFESSKGIVRIEVTLKGAALRRLELHTPKPWLGKSLAEVFDNAFRPWSFLYLQPLPDDPIDPWMQTLPKWLARAIATIKAAGVGQPTYSPRHMRRIEKAVALMGRDLRAAGPSIGKMDSARRLADAWMLPVEAEEIRARLRI